MIGRDRRVFAENRGRRTAAQSADELKQARAATGSARWEALRLWLEAEAAEWDAVEHGATTKPGQSLSAGGAASACRGALRKMTELEAGR